LFPPLFSKLLFLSSIYDYDSLFRSFVRSLAWDVQLNKPIPKDLVSILTKDTEKAKQIVEKSSADAASVKARQIGGAQATSSQLLKKPAVSANPNPSPNPSATGAAKTPKMFIQPIPPFNPNKGKGAPVAGTQPVSGPKKDTKEVGGTRFGRIDVDDWFGRLWV
jgi:hypothetical protein